MATQRVRRYGVIEKMLQQDDGTLQVFGFASTEDEDDQGETITSDAMKAAIPGYMQWGAVREMHQPSAAGTALSAEIDEQGRTRIGVHVVDPVAVQKCLTGTYKAFSIGAKVLKRGSTNKKRIEGIDWIETSLVDRPSNPGAVMVVVKAADADAPEPEEPMEPTTNAPADEIKKGTYSISTFCSLLEQLGWLAKDSAAEAFWEGDNSPVPDKLKAWIAQGASILQAMAAEEVAELVASMGALPSVIEASAKAETVKAALLELEGMKVQATAQESASTELVTKAATLESSVGELTEKVGGLTASLATVTSERDDAIAKASTLEQRATAAEKKVAEFPELIRKATEQLMQKGVLRVVEKNADGVQKSAADEPKLETPKDVHDEIKKIHASAGRVAGS